MRHYAIAIKALAATLITLNLAIALVPTSALAAPASTFAAPRPTLIPGTPPKLSSIAAKRLHITPSGYYCDPEAVYDHITRTGSAFYVTWGPGRNINNTPYNETVTFMTTYSATVALWTTIGVAADTSAIVAGVSASLSITVYASYTTSVSQSVSITVPPGKAGYGEYGVSEVVTSGHYYYVASSCRITDYGTVTAKSPQYPGWSTWIGA